VSTKRSIHPDVDDDCHHEQIPSTQKKFALNTMTVVEAIEELGNPLADDSTDLVTLDTKVIMSEEVVTTIQTAEQLGSTQFIDKRMSGSTKSLYDPINKNNLPLFNSGKKKTSKSSMKTVAMKNDVLFSRMYIACQSREGDLDSFFEH
jgi:hypothetical protein